MSQQHSSRPYSWVNPRLDNARSDKKNNLALKPMAKFKKDEWTGLIRENGRIIIAFDERLIAKAGIGYIGLHMALFGVINILGVTLFHSLNISLILMLLYFIMVFLYRLRKWYNKTFDPIPFYRLPFFSIIFVAALSVLVFYNFHSIKYYADIIQTHEFWLQSLQKSVDGIHYELNLVNSKMLELENQADERYTEWLQEKDSTTNKIETFVAKMWKGFSLIEVTRKEFGLGCFLGDTLITVSNEKNNYYYKKIKDLNETDLIFNPALNKSMKIKVLTQGPENGHGNDKFIYNFVTNDNLTVSVTQTHPMLICRQNDSENKNTMSAPELDNFVCDNVAALNVREGDWTKTVNGLQKIVKLSKKPANGVVVYNVMLDLYPNSKVEEVLKRVVIANGIFTLDLYAQAMH